MSKINVFIEDSGLSYSNYRKEVLNNDLISIQFVFIMGELIYTPDFIKNADILFKVPSRKICFGIICN
jgi:hypothetical protein